MASKLKSKSRIEKAMTLLAISKRSYSATGEDCFDDEALAQHVENSGSYDDVQAAKVWKHLSECTQCYDRWLTLTKVYQAQYTGKRFSIFQIIREQKVVGSALAIAITVALFLNIYPVDPARDKEFSIVKEQQREPAAIAVPDKVLMGEIEQQKEMLRSKTESARVPTPKKEVLLKGAFQDIKQKRPRTQKGAPNAVTTKSVKAIGKRILKEKEETTLQYGHTGRLLESGVQEEKNEVIQSGKEIRSKVASEREVDAIQLWLERVIRSCQKPVVHFEHWSRISAEGKRLIQFLDNIDRADENDKTARSVLNLVQLIDENNVAPQCQKIRSLVQENN